MKHRASQRNSAARIAGGRWLVAILCLCVGLGAGLTFLMSLAQNWGGVQTLGYLAITIGAFVAAALVGKRAATTHL